MMFLLHIRIEVLSKLGAPQDKGVLIVSLWIVVVNLHQFICTGIEYQSVINLAGSPLITTLGRHVKRP
jgi:hypothetical protein